MIADSRVAFRAIAAFVARGGLAALENEKSREGRLLLEQMRKGGRR